MKRVTIFDYGAGNLHSLAKVLKLENVSVDIESDPLKAIETDLFVLPGVGAFSNAAEKLSPALTQIREALKDGLPAIGICLGMQLLFESSDEGPGKGLGVIKGSVRKLKATRIPQIGWNSVEATKTSDEIWNRIQGSPNMYFANSFVCEPDDSDVIRTVTTHETDRFCSAVQAYNTVGVQFHPEKSSTVGVAFLRNAVKQLTEKQNITTNFS